MAAKKSLYINRAGSLKTKQICGTEVTHGLKMSWHQPNLWKRQNNGLGELPSREDSLGSKLIVTPLPSKASIHVLRLLGNPGAESWTSHHETCSEKGFVETRVRHTQKKFRYQYRYLFSVPIISDTVSGKQRKI